MCGINIKVAVTLDESVHPGLPGHSREPSSGTDEGPVQAQSLSILFTSCAAVIAPASDWLSLAAGSAGFLALSAILSDPNPS